MLLSRLTYLALLTLACGPLACVPKWAPRPTSAQSIGVLCAPGREVWCEWGNPECGAVQMAVEQVDKVVPGLLVYKGEMPREALIARLKDSSAVPATIVLRASGVPAERAGYERLPIAITTVTTATDTACLGPEPMVLVWPHAGLNDADWRQVVLHEMLHTLGADHASLQCPFSTVMRPALEMEHRAGLSKADRNWLRAVYGG